MAVSSADTTKDEHGDKIASGCGAASAGVDPALLRTEHGRAGRHAAMLLIDWRKIGPPVYNQAILDAQQAMQEKIAEIDATCYEAEATYWKK